MKTKREMQVTLALAEKSDLPEFKKNLQKAFAFLCISRTPQLRHWSIGLESY